eukprot:1157975-Pelagomonas_calceolata.AAC.12
MDRPQCLQRIKDLSLNAPHILALKASTSSGWVGRGSSSSGGGGGGSRLSLGGLAASTCEAKVGNNACLAAPTFKAKGGKQHLFCCIHERVHARRHTRTRGNRSVWSIGCNRELQIPGTKRGHYEAYTSFPPGGKEGKSLGYMAEGGHHCLDFLTLHLRNVWLFPA